MTKNQLEYQKQIKLLQRRVKEAQRKGYDTSGFQIPEKPKAIRKGTIERIKNLRGRELYQYFTKQGERGDIYAQKQRMLPRYTYSDWIDTGNVKYHDIDNSLQVEQIRYKINPRTGEVIQQETRLITRDKEKPDGKEYYPEPTKPEKPETPEGEKPKPRPGKPDKGDIEQPGDLTYIEELQDKILHLRNYMFSHGNLTRLEDEKYGLLNILNERIAEARADGTLSYYITYLEFNKYALDQAFEVIQNGSDDDEVLAAYHLAFEIIKGGTLTNSEADQAEQLFDAFTSEVDYS